MSKFSMSFRVLTSVLGASAVLVRTTVEASAASGLLKHSEVDWHQKNAGAEHDDVKSAIAQVRVETDRPVLPSQVEVGPVRVRTGNETPATPTPGTQSQQPGTIQDPALVPGAVPTPGSNQSSHQASPMHQVLAFHPSMLAHRW